MPSFGEKLRSEREKRKITLEQVSNSTKIGTRMLQALEEDKFSQLPGGIFNKGFVRAYARTVGLDEEQAVADYLVASGDVPPVRPDAAGRAGNRENFPAPEEEGRLEIRAEAASRQLPWGMFAVVLLVVALALSLWTHRRSEEERRLVQAPAQKITAPGAASRPEPSVPSVPALEPSSVSEQVSGPVHPEKGEAQTRTSSSSAALPGTVRASSTAAPGEFEVLVLAREESWISVSVDGQATASSTLVPGEERTIRAHKSILLKTGNAGALDVHLDGKKLDTGGEFGEVRTFQIGPSGLFTPAPSATSGAH